jgi:hypothetical protein
LLLVIGKTSVGHHTDPGEVTATGKIMKIPAEAGVDFALYRT